MPKRRRRPQESSCLWVNIGGSFADVDYYTLDVWAGAWLRGEFGTPRSYKSFTINTFLEDKTMKKFVNIILTIFAIVILKGLIVAPLYLLIGPLVTAYKWGFTLRDIRMAYPFEVRAVWHTLRNDWHDGCEALIFELGNKENKT